MLDHVRTRLVDALFERTQPPVKPPLEVFAIVDAARSDRIAAMLDRCPTRHACVMGDVPDEELRATLPWLVALDPESPWLRELLDRTWGESTVSFVESVAGFERVRRHLFAIVLVTRPHPVHLHPAELAAEWAAHHGHLQLARSIEAQLDALSPKAIRRLWDPRVMRRVLADPREDAHRIAGPILRFHCESDDASALLSFARSGDAFTCARTALVDASDTARPLSA